MVLLHVHTSTGFATDLTRCVFVGASLNNTCWFGSYWVWKDYFHHRLQFLMIGHRYLLMNFHVVFSKIKNGTLYSAG